MKNVEILDLRKDSPTCGVWTTTAENQISKNKRPGGCLNTRTAVEIVRPSGIRGLCREIIVKRDKANLTFFAFKNLNKKELRAMPEKIIIR